MSSNRALQYLEPGRTENRFLQPDGFLTEMHQVEPMPEAHWHDHVELNLLTGGAMTYLINGSRVTLRAGSLYCFWAAVPHQVTAAEPQTELVCTYLPFADLLSLVISGDFKNDLMSGAILTTAQIDPADTVMLTRWARDWVGASEQLADIMREEVRLRLRRLAVDHIRLDMTDSNGDAEPRRSPRHATERRVASRVQMMTAFINAEFSKPINVGDVARVGGLHPTNATAMFQKVLGQSIAQYLRQRRISHALWLLANTDMAIIEVAFESGHGSLSRFYDAFHRRVGCTPKDYRRRLRV
jgi:AraC-like DNA-binding protein